MKKRTASSHCSGIVISRVPSTIERGTKLPDTDGDHTARVSDRAADRGQ
jgi:hypothetical protein